MKFRILGILLPLFLMAASPAGKPITLGLVLDKKEIKNTGVPIKNNVYTYFKFTAPNSGFSIKNIKLQLAPAFIEDTRLSAIVLSDNNNKPGAVIPLEISGPIELEWKHAKNVENVTFKIKAGKNHPINVINSQSFWVGFKCDLAGPGNQSVLIYGKTLPEKQTIYVGNHETPNGVVPYSMELTSAVSVTIK